MQLHVIFRLDFHEQQQAARLRLANQEPGMFYIFRVVKSTCQVGWADDVYIFHVVKFYIVRYIQAAEIATVGAEIW